MNDDEIRESDSEGKDDPLERARELFAARVPMAGGTSGPPADDDASGSRKLFLGIAIGLVLAVLLPGTVVVVEEQVVDALTSPPQTASLDASDTIYLTAEDASYMSRVFSESRHEVAFCGLITDQDGQPRLEIWLADMLRASPEQVEFISSNCPSGAKEVLIHTHPNGVLGLSDQDRDTLATEPATYMCIQGGELAIEPGAMVTKLACYREADPDSESLALIEIPVRIAS